MSNCFLKAASLALQVSEAELIMEIGHDGTEIWFPMERGCVQKRGFHLQEIQDCFMRRGKGLVYIEAEPVSGTDSGATHDVPMPEGRMDDLLDRYDGILVGHSSDNIPHAVFWNHVLNEQIANVKVISVMSFLLISQL